MAVQTEASRAMSVAERLMVADDLRRFAWELKRSVLHREHPEWSEEQVRAAVRMTFTDGHSDLQLYLLAPLDRTGSRT